VRCRGPSCTFFPSFSFFFLFLLFSPKHDLTGSRQWITQARSMQTCVIRRLEFPPFSLPPFFLFSPLFLLRYAGAEVEQWTIRALQRDGLGASLPPFSSFPSSFFPPHRPVSAGPGRTTPQQRSVVGRAPPPPSLSFPLFLFFCRVAEGAPHA